MTKEEIKEKLREILKLSTDCTEEQAMSYDEQSGLTSDLGLNSVGMLYLVIAVEEFFNIEFDDVNFSDFKVVGDVVDYIYGKKNG